MVAVGDESRTVQAAATAEADLWVRDRNTCPGAGVERGRPIAALQNDSKYVRPGAAIGRSADPENDLYVLDHAARGLGTT